eukprot:884188-Pyramimonas_sp.AAC.2
MLKHLVPAFWTARGFVVAANGRGQIEAVVFVAREHNVHVEIVQKARWSVPIVVMVASPVV